MNSVVDRGFEDLSNAIVMQAFEDFIESMLEIKRLRRKKKRFFKGLKNAYRSNLIQRVLWFDDCDSFFDNNVQLYTTISGDVFRKRAEDITQISMAFCKKNKDIVIENLTKQKEVSNGNSSINHG